MRLKLDLFLRPWRHFVSHPKGFFDWRTSAVALIQRLVPLHTSVSVDSSLCVLSRVVQQSDRQWDMSLSFSLTGGSLTWTRFRPAQSSSDQFSRSLSTASVSLCSSCRVQQDAVFCHARTKLQTITALSGKTLLEKQKKWLCGCSQLPSNGFQLKCCWIQ